MICELSALPEAFRGNAEAPGTSNVAADGAPFQTWYRFKEAFAPSFVEEVVRSQPHPVRTCLDPFGGSGTTGLTCQFMGVRPTLIEVNPFLADLCESKLTSYDARRVLKDRLQLADLCGVSALLDRSTPPLAGAPLTFVEPGTQGRWIFDEPVARRLEQYRCAIEEIEDRASRRLFRVLLGSTLIGLSNVTISGKGRRYRSNWKRRLVTEEDVDASFQRAFQGAYRHICSYSVRRCAEYAIRRGDARELITASEPADLVLFSPPYPNSFDYTDIYNVELWVLGYLRAGSDNRTLREATLRSHVQITREFAAGDHGSTILRETLDRLDAVRDTLWNAHIPAMISAYFVDLLKIIRGAREVLSPTGQVVMVVGDSCYGTVKVDVPAIVQQLVPQVGFECVEVREVRSMRSSPQDGGRFNLGESLIRLSRA